MTAAVLSGGGAGLLQGGLGTPTQKSKRPAGLNLVSLMDIFTILVFFLMVNVGDVAAPNAADGVRLPEGASAASVDLDLVLKVNAQGVALAGEQVVTIATLNSQSDTAQALLVAALTTALTEHQATNTAVPPLTIMADSDIPYALVRQLLSSATAAGLSEVQLAIQQVAPASGEAL